MTKPCCADPRPALSADGLNTVDCANCGATYVVENAEYKEAVLALFRLTETQMQNSDTLAVAKRLKSVPNDDTVHRFAAYILDTCIRLMAKELAAQVPEKRNRLTLSIESPEGEYNLTFARGQYNNAMENQRDEARAERDALRETLQRLESK